MTRLFKTLTHAALVGAAGLTVLGAAGAAQAQHWSRWETWSGRYIGPRTVVRCDDYGYCRRVVVYGHDRYRYAPLVAYHHYGYRHYGYGYGYRSGYHRGYRHHHRW